MLDIDNQQVYTSKQFSTVLEIHGKNPTKLVAASSFKLPSIEDTSNFEKLHLKCAEIDAVILLELLQKYKTVRHILLEDVKIIDTLNMQNSEGSQFSTLIPQSGLLSCPDQLQYYTKISTNLKSFLFVLLSDERWRRNVSLKIVFREQQLLSLSGRELEVSYADFCLLPNIFDQNRLSLTVLHLSHCTINGKTFATTLGKHVNLTVLKLFQIQIVNKITGSVHLPQIREFRFIHKCEERNNVDSHSFHVNNFTFFYKRQDNPCWWISPKSEDELDAIVVLWGMTYINSNEKVSVISKNVVDDIANNDNIRMISKSGYLTQLTLCNVDLNIQDFLKSLDSVSENLECVKLQKIHCSSNSNPLHIDNVKAAGISLPNLRHFSLDLIIQFWTQNEFENYVKALELKSLLRINQGFSGSQPQLNIKICINDFIILNVDHGSQELYIYCLPEAESILTDIVWSNGHFALSKLQLRDCIVEQAALAKSLPMHLKQLELYDVQIQYAILPPYDEELIFLPELKHYRFIQTKNHAVGRCTQPWNLSELTIFKRLKSTGEDWWWNIVNTDIDAVVNIWGMTFIDTSRRLRILRRSSLKTNMEINCQLTLDENGDLSELTLSDCEISLLGLKKSLGIDNVWKTIEHICLVSVKLVEEEKILAATNRLYLPRLQSFTCKLIGRDYYQFMQVLKPEEIVFFSKIRNQLPLAVTPLGLSASKVMEEFQQIWCSQTNIKIRLGVTTILEVHHEHNELVMYKMKNSKYLLEGIANRNHLLAKLALWRCDFHFVHPGSLTFLNLYRVHIPNDFLRKCVSLKDLRIWSDEWDTIDLAIDLVSLTLKNVAIGQSKIICPTSPSPQVKNILSKIEQLFIHRCFIEDDIFHLFPSLRKVAVYGQCGTPPTPLVLMTILQLKHIEWIGMKEFKWTFFSPSEKTMKLELEKLIRSAKGNINDNEKDFTLQKINTTDADTKGKWRGRKLGFDECQSFQYQHFQWHKFWNFKYF